MKSMTGFGKHTDEQDTYQVAVEIKSVNHRFLDSQIKLPAEYNHLELVIRQAIKAKLARGRVECFVTVRQESSGQKEVAVNWELLDSLLVQLECLEEKNEAFKSLDTNQIVAGLARHQDFFEVHEKRIELEDIDSVIQQTLLVALAKLEESRAKEGRLIKDVLENYNNEFLSSIKEVQVLSELFASEHSERLSNKLTELLEGQLDEGRILTEVALLVDRADISEELERLVIHNQNLGTLLKKEQAVGRELDFLIQEMNREVNTIGSKTSEIKIKELVVQMKVILEKIREQIQNIE